MCMCGGSWQGGEEVGGSLVRLMLRGQEVDEMKVKKCTVASVFSYRIKLENAIKT